jgi:epsilon-lactone hydrolase
MRTLRERLVWWSLIRFLHAARRGLARNPTPTRVRHDMARFERRLSARMDYRRSAPVDLGDCTGEWIDTSPEAGRVILYLHGGAFVAASPYTHGLLLAKLCRVAGARGLYVDYRLAPEHPFPAAGDDCLAGYRYLLEQGIDPARIVIAGDSAGGNLTVGTALRARDSGLPLPAALVAISPVLDATFSGDSVQRNDGLDPLFRASVFTALADQYVPPQRRSDPDVSPLFADLTGLPPSLVIVGSSELLLDDSLRFASKAANVTLQVWHDMPHVFPAMHGLPEAERAVRVMGEYIAARTPLPAAANPGTDQHARC